MRSYELAKHEPRHDGRVQMCIEGPTEKIHEIELIMSLHFPSTNCEEEGAREGETIVFFIIDRGDKEYFMKCWKSAKSE